MAILKLGGDAEKETGRFVLPVEGAVGIYFVNESKAKLTNNFFNGKLENAVEGVVSPNADYTPLKLGLGTIKTAIPETAEMTVFAIFKTASVTNGGMIVSNFSTAISGVYGLGLQCLKTSEFQFMATVVKSDGGTTAGGAKAAFDMNTWTLAAGRTTGGINTAINLTKGVTAFANFVARGAVRDGGLMRIGGGYENQYNDGFDIAAVVIYNRALSDNEITSVGDVLRQYAAKHGLSV